MNNKNADFHPCYNLVPLSGYNDLLHTHHRSSIHYVELASIDILVGLYHKHKHFVENHEVINSNCIKTRFQEMNNLLKLQYTMKDVAPQTIVDFSTLLENISILLICVTNATLKLHLCIYKISGI